MIKANTELSVDDVNYARVQEIKLAITTKSSKVRSTNDCYIDRKPVFNLLINEGTMIPKKIFLSYARVDKKYKEELDKHFAALKRDKRIEVWHDGAIEAGDVADEITKKELANADIVLLLLSPGFMNSKYIWEIEIPKAIEKGATIVPIFLKPCDFNESEFGIHKFQGLPGEMKWIVKFRHRDEAYLKVVEGIKRVL